MSFWDTMMSQSDEPLYKRAGYATAGEWLKAVSEGKTPVMSPIENTVGNAESGYSGTPVEGYYGYTPRADGKYAKNGAQYESYDPEGKFLGNRDFKDMSGVDPLLAAFLAAAGGMAFGLPALGFNAGTAAGAGAGAGLGAAGAAGVGELTAAQVAELIAAEQAAAGVGAGTASMGAGAAGVGEMTAAQAAEMIAAEQAAAGVGSGAAGAAGSAAPNLLQQAAAKLGPGTVQQLLQGGSTLDTIAKIAGIAAPIIGGKMGADAAGDAANAQLQATREAAARTEPFYKGGEKGLNRLLDLYGLSDNKGAEGYGSAMRKFGMSDFQADPGYQFVREEGERGLQRAASAHGGLGSGRYLKDAMRFNTGLASNEYGKAYDRYGTDIARQINPLQALAGQGQSAANTIGGYTLDGGNARAAGRVGSANAWGNALTQGLSAYQNQQAQAQNNQLMERWLQSRGV